MDKPSFEASLRALARRRAQENHPEPSELAAYHAGELTEDQEEKIQDHLTICEECAQLLLGFSEYSRFQPSKDADAAADDQSAAAWQRFQARLRDEEEPATREEVPSAPVVPLQRRPPAPVWKARLPWALAATLAAYALGMTLWYVNLRKDYNALNEPGFVHYNSLQSEEGTLRGGEVGEPEPSASSTGELHYELNLPGPPDEAATYEVEILAAEEEGKPRWSGQDRAPEGYLTVKVPQSYPSGPYRFRVHKIEGNGSRTLVGTYSFVVP